MLARVLPLALTIAVLAWSAVAEPLLPQPSAKPAAKQSIRQPAANPCAAFGPGFVRMEGSDTCIKLGGATSFGAGGNVR